MKQFFTTLFCLLAASISNCHAQSAPSSKNYQLILVSHHDEKGRYIDKAVRKNFGEIDIPNTFQALQVKRTDSARMAINNLRNRPTNNITNSFVFNAADLKRYIETTSSPTLEIILGTDTSTNKALLIISTIDTNADHYYLRDISTNNCHIATSMNQPPQISQTYDATGAQQIAGYYFGAAIVDSANSWLNNFSGPINPGQYSWVYSADLLAKYIEKAGTNALYIEFKLCNMYGKITLLAAAVNGQGKHIYFRYKKSNCILENFNPCPYCAVNPLENCSQ